MLIAYFFSGNTVSNTATVGVNNAFTMRQNIIVKKIVCNSLIIDAANIVKPITKGTHAISATNINTYFAAQMIAGAAIYPRVYSSEYYPGVFYGDLYFTAGTSISIQNQVYGNFAIGDIYSAICEVHYINE